VALRWPPVIGLSPGAQTGMRFEAPEKMVRTMTFIRGRKRRARREAWGAAVAGAAMTDNRPESEGRL
jgi:hypothetical protein